MGNSLFEKITRIDQALQRGDYDDLFERAPECKERLHEALKTAGTAAIEAEMRAHPEVYQEYPEGKWGLIEESSRH
jgi:hypothetical protein